PRHVPLIVHAPLDTSTLSLHDALPISMGLASHHARTRASSGGVRFRRGVPSVARRTSEGCEPGQRRAARRAATIEGPGRQDGGRDRKSTRLNSSHGSISYAVFCLKKKT